MSDDVQKKLLTRRGALRSLFGGRIRDRMRVTGLVEDYRTVLRDVAGDLAFGVPVERLPAPPAAIAEAIVEAASKSLMDLPRVTLCDAYASLALFRDASEIEILHRGKADFDRQDFSEEAQERIRVTFERRNVLLLERSRMEREFEARVPPPASKDADEEST